MLALQISASLIVTIMMSGVVSAALITKLYSISVNTSQLFEINQATGASRGNVAISVAGKTVTGGTGLAKDPTTGTLYALLKLSDALTCLGGGKRSTLVTLAPTTGIATMVGSSNSGNTGDCFAGIAFHTNGTLYGITGDGATTPRTLYTLNKTTGARILPEAKTLGNGGDGETIGFNPDNALLFHASGNDTSGSPPLVQVFESINPANLGAAPVNIPRSGGDYAEALALTYKGSGVFFITDGDAPGNVTPQLLTITTSGVIASVGTMNHPSKGLAFVTTTETLLSVQCPGDSLQSAIDIASPGDIINVSGTCNENVLVRNEKQRLTIDGGGTATINGTSFTSSAVTIRGKGILIKGFTISGNSAGIAVNRGSNAVIDNNVIDNTGGHGVLVDQLAFVVLINNTIQNNTAGSGVVVSENSTARIGFNLDSDTTASPNTIQSNNLGIAVMNGSSARIIGNSVSFNSGDGILVVRDSHADIAFNSIDFNGDDGIEVGENSFVQLGEDAGVSIFESPNDSAFGNNSFGVKCTSGGAADGAIGTLTGSAGTKDFTDSTCIDSLNP